MGGFSLWHILILAILVLLLFGGNRFSNMMGDLAKGMKQFKQGMSDDEEEKRRRYEEERRRNERTAPDEQREPATRAAAAQRTLDHGRSPGRAGDAADRTADGLGPTLEDEPDDGRHDRRTNSRDEPAWHDRRREDADRDAQADEYSDRIPLAHGRSQCRGFTRRGRAGT